MSANEKVSTAKDTTTKEQILAKISNTTKAAELKRIATVLRLIRNPEDQKTLATIRDQQANDFIESRGFRSGRR